MKLQAKLLSVLIPLAMVSGALIVFLSHQAVDKILIAGVAERGFLGLAEISSEVGTGMRTKNEKALLPLLHEIHGRLGASYAMALDPSGAVLAHTNVLEKGKVHGDPVARQALLYEKPTFQLVDVHGKRVLDVSAPVWTEDEDFLLAQEKGGKTRLGTLRLGLPLDEAMGVRARIINHIALILLAAGSAMMLVLLFFLRNILFPVRLLADATQKIGQGQYGVTLPVLSRDELGMLTNAFNAMSHDLKRSTEEVRLAKDYIDNVVRSMADALIVVNPDATIRTINQTVLDLLGYEEHELIGKPVRILTETETETLFKGTNFKKLLQEGSVHDFRSTLRRKTGERIPVSLSGAVMRNAESHVVGVVSIARDIREILRLQDHERNIQVTAAAEKARMEALQERAEELQKTCDDLKSREEDLRLFRGLIDQSNDAIFVIDAETARLLDVNEKVCSNLGYSRGELLRMRIVDVDAAIPDNFSWKAHAAEVRARGFVVLEGGHRRKDGSAFSVEVNVKHASIGQKEYLVAVARDITERKKLEKMVLQSEKMAAVGQLAGGVAHEINNPIGIILGFAQSVARGVKENGPLALPLRSIEREAVRCKELVQNLLAFSRSSSPEHREETDINSCVQQALSLVLAQTKVKEIQVLQEPDQNPPKMRANKNQIQQVVINLCNNAIDAMPKGGRLTVRTGQAAQNGALWASLEISDTGTGIPRGVQSRIFEPFFTTKEVGKGTGLGLALVHEIVQKHGGTIELSSEEGQGATFMIQLPALVNEGHAS